jgi:predicted ATPase
MIESIEIKNWKSIKGKYFPLRNLNVLLGLNGMGKSSFIQFLLSLSSSDLTNGRLNLNGRFVNIGTTKDALYQYAQKAPLAFTLKCSETESFAMQFDYQHEADVFTDESIATRMRNPDDLIRSISLTEPLFKRANFQYLCASRMDPTSLSSKNYSLVVASRNLGMHGEHVAHFIETFGNEEIVIEGLAHKDSEVEDRTTGKKLKVLNLINQINLWMGEISPNVTVRTTEVSTDYVLLEYAYKQPNLGSTNRFKPENVGFGISYVLPVVVALLKARPGDLLIVENPESHVHPRGQAELGKMIAIAAMNGVQIILETHSDHVINGIRVAVKEKQIERDKVVIFYFDKVIAASEQYSKITNIEIDQNGELSDYPKDMMDEWANQLFKLM